LRDGCGAFWYNLRQTGSKEAMDDFEFYSPTRFVFGRGVTLGNFMPLGDEDVSAILKKAAGL